MKAERDIEVFWTALPTRDVNVMCTVSPVHMPFCLGCQSMDNGNDAASQLLKPILSSGLRMIERIEINIAAAQGCGSGVI